MNTEQTKTLGEILWMAHNPDATWSDVHQFMRERLERTAQAVATEVLKRYGISPVPEQQPQLGSLEGVHPPVQESLHQGSDVLPEPQTQFWTCETCGRSFRAGEAHFCPGPSTDNPTWASNAMTTPPAPCAEWKPRFKVGDRVQWHTESGLQGVIVVLPETADELARQRVCVRWAGKNNVWELEEKLELAEPAPWKLPEPPEGMQWHRVDGWHKEWLPKGYRPLLQDEIIEPVDQSIWENSTDFRGTGSSIGHAAGQIWNQTHWFRTRRPLPTPPVPSNVNAQASADYWREMYEAQTISLRKEVAAALARASEVEKQLADIQREFGRIQGTSAKSVVDRFLDLMRKLNEKDLPAGFESWESFLKYIDGIKARAVAAESELATARASVPVWVPIETHPTDITARILYHDGKRAVADGSWNMGRPTWARFWCPFPPLPVETEKGDGFEEWWKEMSEGNFWLNEIHKTASRKAWQAALRSKKPS
jgi:hypothetical protein